MNPQAISGLLNTVFFYLSRVIWTFGYPLDVIWRHHMGERQAAIWKVWLHVFLVGGIISGISLAQSLESNWKAATAAKSPPVQNDSAVLPPGFPPGGVKDDQQQATDDVAQKVEQLNFKKRNESAFEVFAGITFFFAFLNHFQVVNKRKQGIRWHSRFYGVPRFLPDNRLTNAWLIPLGSFSVGLWVQYYFPGLGAYILFMAVIQFLAFRLQEAREYNQWLDAQDRQISVDHMKSAIEGANALDNAGFAVPGFRKAARTNKPEKVYRAVTTEDIADRFREVMDPTPKPPTDRQ